MDKRSPNEGGLPMYDACNPQLRGTSRTSLKKAWHSGSPLMAKHDVVAFFVVVPTSCHLEPGFAIARRNVFSRLGCSRLKPAVILSFAGVDVAGTCAQVWTASDELKADGAPAPLEAVTRQPSVIARSHPCKAVEHRLLFVSNSWIDST